MHNGQSLCMPTVLLYGSTKIGKSSCAILALKDKAFWICTERGALAPATDKAVNPDGVIPKFVECLDPNLPFEEMQKAVSIATQMVRDGKVAAIIIDTLSSFADREYARILTKDKVPENYGKAAKALAHKVKSLLWQLMDSGAIVICICHQKDPVTIEGNFFPGGPKLSGKLVEDVPSLFSTVLRCAVDIDAEGVKKRVFKCDPLDRRYITGDRYGVVNGSAEMDLRAVLKASIAKAKEANDKA